MALYCQIIQSKETIIIHLEITGNRNCQWRMAQDMNSFEELYCGSVMESGGSDDVGWSCLEVESEWSGLANLASDSMIRRWWV
jgi:hypothetical protein